MLVFSAGYGRAAGPYAVSNFDTITVTGDVTTNTSNAAAIRATGDTLSPGSKYIGGTTIINHGTLTTTGGSAAGIAVQEIGGGVLSATTLVGSNTITNTGAISTTGGSSSGIAVESASIFSYVADALTSSNTITNSGAISTSGALSAGIVTGSLVLTGFEGTATTVDNTIANSGDLTVSGAGASGIDVFGTAFIINSGNGVAAGNVIVSGNTISNSGSVAVSGSGTNDDNKYSTPLLLPASGIKVSGTTVTALSERSIDGYHVTSDTVVDGNQITNSGQVSTTGDYSNALAVTGLSSSALIAVTPNFLNNAYIGNSTLTAQTTVSANEITNSGAISTTGYGSAGIAINGVASAVSTAYAHGYAYRYSSNAYSADAHILDQLSSSAVVVSGNTITNSGAITVSGGNTPSFPLSPSGGIVMTAFSTSMNSASNDASAVSYYNNAFAGDATITNSAAKASATLSGNTITNSGAITTSEKSSYGIALIGASQASNNANNNSYGYSYNDNDYSGLAAVYDGYAIARTDVIGNVISNSGKISTSGMDAAGIAVVGYAGAVNSASNSQNGDAKVYGSYAVATAYVTGNQISNSGAITTSGVNASGIEVGAFAHASNSAPDGYSYVYGSYARAIANVAGNSISNSGKIATSGDDANGILIGAYASAETGYGNPAVGPSVDSNGAYAHISENTITNSGSISTTGLDASGIRLSAGVTGPKYGSGSVATITGNTVTNTGTIATTGDYAHGIDIRATANGGYYDYAAAYISGNTISNSGVIHTTGEAAHGVYLHASVNYGYATVTNNTITNTGSIETFGANSDAIRLSAYYVAGTEAVTGNTINNSGRLLSVYGSAINISGGYENTVNISAPAFIAGHLSLGDSDTVNLESGPSQSNFWTFEGTNTTFNTSGPLPWFHKSDEFGSTYATFDPTGVVGRENVLADTASMASGFMQRGLDTLNATADKFRVWAVGGRTEQAYDGNGTTTLKQDVGLTGGAIGIGAKITPDTMIGAMVAGSYATMKADSKFSQSYDNSTDGVAGGVFLRHAFSGLSLDLGVNGGWTKTSVRRYVNDNLADNAYANGGTADTGHATLGNAWNEANYHAWWLSPEAAIAYKIDLADGMSLTPAARVRYAMEQDPSYTETTTSTRVADGSVSSVANVGAYNPSVMEGDFGLTLTRGFSMGSASLSAGYIVRESFGSSSIDVSMLDMTAAVPVDASKFDAPYVGAGFSVGFGARFALDVNGRAIFIDNEVGSSVMATLRSSF